MPDLQNPIKVMVDPFRKALKKNLDVCFGIRGRRAASVFLRIAYSAFYRIIDWLADHDWPRYTGDSCVMHIAGTSVMAVLESDG